MTDTPPDLPVAPVRRSLIERVSLVWLIPATALLIALGVAWSAYSDRGPLIVISFADASGVRAGETVLRYRDVTVGLVERVAFSEGLDKVRVSVRLDKAIAPYVDADARFWVVTPKVTARGVSGLDTVLSGVYIAGLWDATPGETVAAFQGLPEAPLLLLGERGLRLTLRASPGAVLSEGVPIIFKGVTVGRTGAPRLVEGGTRAVVDAVILAPHDQLITSATRFWDTSGFSLSLGAGGAEIDFTSLATLIGGGLTFDTLVSGGRPVGDRTVFDLFPDEETARASVFEATSGPALDLAVVFDENVSGLEPGARVELGGVHVGEVTALRGLVDPDRFGDNRVRLLAVLALRPDRLGLAGEVTPLAARSFLADRVADGLRARLATSGLFGTSLIVEFIQVVDPPEAALQVIEGQLPVMPSTQSNIRDVAATAQGVLKRLNDLPVEQLLNSAIGLLDNASSLIASEDVKRAPTEVVGLIADARGMLGSPAVQGLPVELNALIADLRAVTADMGDLLTRIETTDAIGRVLAAVDAAGAAAQAASDSVSEVPQLVSEVTELVDRLGNLPLDDLVARATDILATTEALLSAPGAAELPATLNGALGELRDALSELRAGGTVVNVNRTLASAASAADAVSEASAQLPALVERLTRVADQANATLAGYAGNSEINRDARAALRQVQQAAEAITSLARALERRPNSIILGR